MGSNGTRWRVESLSTRTLLTAWVSCCAKSKIEFLSRYLFRKILNCI
jgi:hypothetical protein